MKAAGKFIKQLIKKSEYQTLDNFSRVSGIPDTTISKYCQGTQEFYPEHFDIIRNLLINPSIDLSMDEIAQLRKQLTDIRKTKSRGDL